ncbi:competence protein CoiA (plasmid) [Priestia megaterium]|uniref:competence protein CoiA n=1 Tax=Priestia megaterium TaxID=1404 RepID=UPI00351F34C1
MLRCITKEQISLYAPSCDEKSTRKLSQNDLLLCPNCLKKVTFNRGPKKGSYFSHRKDAECIVTNYEPETLDHQQGKSILLDWLKKRFKEAKVELEKYIPKTEQIADILVTHTSGPAKGLVWAFEFQHSDLSAKEWERRHNLYNSANIHDFWILDANRFLLHSNSKDTYVQKARRLKDPQEKIFSKTGFCYFLNLTNIEMTIDFSFRYEDIAVEKAGGGTYPKTEYKFHNPHKHSCKLNDIKFYSNNEFNYAAMCYDDIHKDSSRKFQLQVNKLKKEKQKNWDNELQIRARQKKEYAINKYGETFSNYMWDFIKANREEIKEDVYSLHEEEFFLKYEKYVIKYQSNEEEILTWKDSSNINHCILYRLCDWEEKEKLQKISFLEKQEQSLEVYLMDKFSRQIEMVNYVLSHYDNLLEVLESRRASIIRKRLNEINWRISPSGTNGTKFEYAFPYHKIETKEEVDSILKEIKEKLHL